MTYPDPLALVGTTVAEKYEIERVVGEGGFALVYRAMHKVWNRPVAIKVFRALGDLPHERRREMVEMFIQEGRLLADLSERTAAIVQARDVGTMIAGDGREMPYMVLEWLEGRSLEQVINDEKAAGMPPRTPEQALALLEPAAHALALAHRKGIAHRDVKPANLFILGDPRGEYTVKVLDFGIAKVVQDMQRLGGSFAQTQGVMSSFTPLYGAPEQFSRAHGATGPWTDVFALALIFTELVTNEPAIRGDDLTQLAFSSMDPRRRPTPRTYGFPTSDALESTLLRALAVNVDDRFRSMTELWEALRASLAMAPARGFTDSMRMGARGVSQPSFDPSRTPPTAPTMPLGPVAPPANLSPPVPVKKTPVAAIAAGCGALLFVGLALVGGALYKRSHPTPTVEPSSTASVPLASASIAPVPPTCPEGMTTIAAGRFFMGSDDRKDEERERPAHQVTLPSYCMDTTEVTVAQYLECSKTGGCKRGPQENEFPDISARDRKLYDPLCNIREAETKGSYPINCVDWELADAFCTINGKRLPTEAEWEYATRGSDGRKYPWGDDAPVTGDFLNACGKECVAWGKKHPNPDYPLTAMYQADDGWPTTAPVGSFPKGTSRSGLKDVVGNVWEWTSDWFGDYTAAASTDPKGPPTGEMRVMRGGAWNGSDPGWVRPSFRFMATPTLRSHGVGFRCAKSL